MENKPDVLEESTELFFSSIHNRIVGFLDPNGMEFLNKTMEDASRMLNHAFPAKPLEDNEREALKVYLSWLFNSLLNIAAADKNGM
jgi:hypothetical protein